MKYERYPVRAYDSYRRFKFYSKGPKGRIAKRVLYRPIYPGAKTYNLGFGDTDGTNGDINDEAVTNNGDTAKVLATISHTVLKFLEMHPRKSIYVLGSSFARSRLYRIVITRSVDFLPKKFQVLGRIGDDWLPFRSGVIYDAFIIRVKN